MKKLLLWIFAVALVAGFTVAQSQTLFDLEIESSDHSFCRDIPARTDSNSGWLTNRPLEDAFRRHVARIPSRIFAALAFGGGFFRENNIVGHMESARSREQEVRIELRRGFLLFPANKIKTLSGTQLTEIQEVWKTAATALGDEQTNGMALERWVLDLHWHLQHPSWHGSGSRKIIILSNKRDPASENPTIRGAQCELFDVPIQLLRLASFA